MPAARRACRSLQGRKLVTARCLPQFERPFDLGQRWVGGQLEEPDAKLRRVAFQHITNTSGRNFATSHRARLVRVAMCVKKPCPTCGKAGLSRFTWAG